MSETPKPTAASIDEAIAKALLDALENGVTATDNEGNVVKLSPSPAMITAGINYLKTKGNADPAVVNTVAGKFTERINKHLKLAGVNKDIIKTPIEELDERATA